MEWTQFLILIITLGSLFLWNRSEANADRREAQNLIRAIEQEIKDFHARLFSLETKKKK